MGVSACRDAMFLEEQPGKGSPRERHLSKDLKEAGEREKEWRAQALKHI